MIRIPNYKSDLQVKAKQYAISCHEKTNHTYDGQPYSVHLQMTVDAAERHIDLIPEQDQPTVISAQWGHDTIEDTRITWNDLKKELNEDIANIVYALTNEKGKNRPERANAKYYRGIRRTKYAVFCKLADRIGNAKYSADKRQTCKGEGMFEKYQKEHPKFIWSLIKPEWHNIPAHLYRILTYIVAFCCVPNPKLCHKLYIANYKMKHPYFLMIAELEEILEIKPLQ